MFFCILPTPQQGRGIICLCTLLTNRSAQHTLTGKEYILDILEIIFRMRPSQSIGSIRIGLPENMRNTQAVPYDGDLLRINLSCNGNGKDDHIQENQEFFHVLAAFLYDNQTLILLTTMDPQSRSYTGVYVRLALTAFSWGGTFIATRVAAQTFEPFTGAGFRYAIAFLFLLPMALWEDGRFFRIKAKQFPPLFIAGCSGIFAYNYFFFHGLKTIPASRAAVIAALNPTFVLIISAIIYRERITLRKFSGMLISLCGVVLVISRGNIFQILSAMETGDLFMLGCPISWAIYTVAGREATKSCSPLQATTWASAIGLFLLLVMSFTEPFPDTVDLDVWLSLGYLGLIGTVIAFVWYYEGIRRIGATRTAIFNNLVPVSAMLFSVLILKEEVTWYTWVGGGLVISGIVLINLRLGGKTVS